MIEQIVRQLEELIREAASLQDPYVRSLCSVCRYPCCARVEYLFSEKDILFLKLSGRSSPRRRGRKRRKGCVHLLPSGCRLVPEDRPLACHRYLCPQLKAKMHERDPGLVQSLEGIFRKMDALQSRLWNAYLVKIRSGEPFPFGKAVKGANRNPPRSRPAEAPYKPNESLHSEIP